MSLKMTCVLGFSLGLGLAGSSLYGAERTRSGLVALYDFNAPGAVVRDVSGARDAVNLRIADTNAGRWHAGALEVRVKTVIRSDRPATRISDAIRLSGRFTVEAWVRPATTTATGPARMVTLSPNSSQRNFTLGQDGARF